jgi:hypothetical protein
MHRRFVLLLACVAATAIPALAQTQAHPPHPQGTAHPSHGQMDPALHALLHGTWTGTVTPSTGAPVKLQVAVATDKQGNTSLKVSGDPSLKAGASTDVKLDDKGLHWTQALAGETCAATAKIEGQEHHGAASLTGKMACGKTELPFALEKTKG